MENERPTYKRVIGFSVTEEIGEKMDEISAKKAMTMAGWLREIIEREIEGEGEGSR